MLTSQSYEQLVLKTSDNWLIDFYAPWCQHCQIFAPTFETIASVSLKKYFSLLKFQEFL
jgi:thioredoxin-like negative regulator of GroEL